MPKAPPTKIPEQLPDLMEEDAGKGVSTELSDFAFWLDDIDRNWDWYKALLALDEEGNNRPIIRLLKAKAPPVSISVHLADVFNRYDLVPRKTTGPKARPTYQRSKAMIVLESAVQEVRERARRIPREQAIEKAALRRKLNPDTLREACDGKHGGLNRARRGDPPKFSAKAKAAK